MNYVEYYKTEYLAGEDLYEGPVTVTIKKVFGKEDNLGDGKKLYQIVEFDELEQRLVLNVTNARSIANIVGDGEDQVWKGTQIELYSIIGTAFGETKPWIRIREAAPTKIIAEIKNCKSLDELSTLYKGLDAGVRKHKTILETINQRKAELK